MLRAERADRADQASVFAPSRVETSCAIPGATVAIVSYPRGVDQARHEHDYTNISLVLAGQLEETSAAGTVHAGPLSLVIKPACCAHADRLGPCGARLLTVRFLGPPDRLIPRDAGHPRDRSWHQTLAGYGWTHGGPVAAAMVRLGGHLRASSRDPAAIEEAVLNVVGLAAELRGATLPGDAPRIIREILGILRAEYVHPPSVRALAGRVGVHPVYLARLFRRITGCSVTQYIHALRVRHGAAALARAAAPSASLGQRLGFADQSHWCRVFKRHLGLRPRDFHALAAGRPG